MTGPFTSMAVGGAGAILATVVFGSDAFWIAIYGGAGGLSRWLYFALNGAVERWYKGIAHVLLSVLFVSGIFPIAPAIINFVIGKTDGGLAIDPGGNLGVAYFIGMFTTVLIGAVEDKIKSKDQKKRAGDV